MNHSSLLPSSSSFPSLCFSFSHFSFILSRQRHMEPSQPPPRLAGQRKRSYSTTAYSSHEEESPLAASSPSLPTCLLATAVGAQVMTYEFIKHDAEPLPPSKSTTASQGQYEGIMMSNERTTYGAISSLKWSPDSKCELFFEVTNKAKSTYIEIEIPSPCTLDTILAVEAQDGRIIVYNDKGKVQEALVSEPVLEVSRSSHMPWTKQKFMTMESKDTNCTFPDITDRKQSLRHRLVAQTTTTLLRQRTQNFCLGFGL